MPKPLTIAFYSPVSGNGSSLLALNLFEYYRSFCESENYVLLDCDISYPTLRYYLEVGEAHTTDVYAEMPHILREKCILCKVCEKACHFGAIRISGSINQVTFVEKKCIACGACLNTCRHAAIVPRDHKIGKYMVSELEEKTFLIDAGQDVPERFHVPVIQAMKAKAMNYSFVIIDAKPGLSAESLESIYDADLLIMVADARSFAGMHCNTILPDLKKLTAKQSILINRCAGKPVHVHEYAIQHNIPIIYEMPFDEKFQLTGMNGEIAVKKQTDYLSAFDTIASNIEKILNS